MAKLCIFLYIYKKYHTFAREFDNKVKKLTNFISTNSMKKVLLIAAIALATVGCCKKAENKQCCKEGDKKECCQKQEEGAQKPECCLKQDSCCAEKKACCQEGEQKECCKKADEAQAEENAAE